MPRPYLFILPLLLIPLQRTKELCLLPYHPLICLIYLSHLVSLDSLNMPRPYLFILPLLLIPLWRTKELCSIRIKQGLQCTVHECSYNYFVPTLLYLSPLVFLDSLNMPRPYLFILPLQLIPLWRTKELCSVMPSATILPSDLHKLLVSSYIFRSSEHAWAILVHPPSPTFPIVAV
jgi:hypothetical protein